MTDTVSQYEKDRIIKSVKEAIANDNVDYIVSVGARIKNSEDGVYTNYTVIPKHCHDEICEIIKLNGESNV